MSTVGQKEHATQNRVIKLFRERLDYTYLCNWEEEERAMPVEDGLLCAYLTKAGCSCFTPTVDSETPERLSGTNPPVEAGVCHRRNSFLFRQEVQVHAELAEASPGIEQFAGEL